MATINGKLWIVKDNATTIGGTTSAKLNIKQNHEETQNKSTTDDFITRMTTTKDWSIDFEGFFDPGEAYNAEEIVDIILSASNTLTAKFQPSSPVVDDILFSGVAIIDTFDMDAPNQGPMTISGTFVANGTLTKTVQV